MTAPTTRETADHAELLLMANAALEIYSDDVLVVGGARRIHADNIILAVKNGVDRLIANETALLSEIAALRGERDRDNAELLALIDRWEGRSTQAERQRDEAVGLLRRYRSDLPTEALEDLTDAFLAKQAADPAPVKKERAWICPQDNTPCPPECDSDDRRHCASVACKEQPE